MNTATQTQAERTYQARQAAIRQLMDELQGHLSDHADKAAKRPGDWGYAGDLGRVEELMREVVDGLAGRG